MTVLVHGMIVFGIIIMITNIVRHVRFIIGSKDVLSSGDKKDRAWEYVSLLLLIFFLIGYILVTLIGKPDIIIAGILFGGSIFVAIVLTLIFRLISTVKENSLNIAETLISVVDARDPNLRGHSRYVQNVTMAIYDHLPSENKNGINRVSLEFAALMHDVGKLGIQPSHSFALCAFLHQKELVVIYPILFEFSNYGFNFFSKAGHMGLVLIDRQIISMLVKNAAKNQGLSCIIESLKSVFSKFGKHYFCKPVKTHDIYVHARMGRMAHNDPFLHLKSRLLRHYYYKFLFRKADSLFYQFINN